MNSNSNKIFTLSVLEKITSLGIPVFLTLLGIVLILSVAKQLWLVAIALIGFFGIVISNRIFFNKPEIVLTFAIFINFCAYSSGMRSIGYVILFFLTGFLIVTTWIHKNVKLSFDIPLSLWFCIILTGFFSFFQWHSISLGLKAILHLAVAPFAVYLLITGNYINNDGRQWLITKGLPFICIFVISSTLTAACLIFIRADFSLLDLSVFRKLYIPDNGSNRLADLLIFCSVLLYTTNKIWRISWWKRLLFPVFIVLGFLLSFMIISRGTLLAFIAVAFLYYSTTAFMGEKLKPGPMVLIIILVILLLKPFIEKIIFRLSIMSIDYANISRLLLWKDSFLLMKSHPLTGYGPGQFVYAVLTQIHEDPHNVFLRYGVEFGPVTIILLGIILYYPIILFKKLFKQNKILAKELLFIFTPPICMTLLHSQVDYIITSISYGPFFWVVWSLMVKSLSDGLANSSYVRNYL